MKLFLDTADIEEIRAAHGTRLIDGVTTNPTLILRSGRTLPDVAKQLVDEFPNFESISTEVVADNVADMVNQGLAYKRLGSSITIKLPCTVEGLKACKNLSNSGIKTNVTLIFSAAQAILAAKAGATYVSPFVGRVDDNSFDGIKLIEEIKNIYMMNGVETQILAASVRTVRQVTDSFLAGADIVTLPKATLDKMYKHILTDAGLAQFEKDWAQVPKT